MNATESAAALPQLGNPTLFVARILTNASLLANDSPFIWVTALLVTGVFISCTTRYLSGSWLRSKEMQLGVKSVGMLPYWIPLLGHLVSFATNPDTLMRQARDNSIHGAFSLNLGGSTHNIVYTPSLIKAIFQQRSNVLDFEAIQWFILVNVFGADPKRKTECVPCYKALTACITNHVSRGPSLEKMLGLTVRSMEENIPNLVSFSYSPVDQTIWERSSNPLVLANLKDSASTDLTVEASLFPILRNFVGSMSLPSLMGSAFMEYYPTVLQDLWALDQGFKWLIMGLPRWIPIRSLTKAHIARKNLIRGIAVWQRALGLALAGEDAGAEWRDMGDVSEVMKSRSEVWKSAGIVPDASEDLAVIWAMNVNANTLVFWLLLRILSTPDLATQVLAEIKPYVTISQPEQVLGFPEPPQVRFSTEGLIHTCPLFKACYYETLRMDSEPWSLKMISKDFVITESKDEVRGEPESYLLKAGEYVNCPHDVHQTDPHFFQNPEVFDPERFLDTDEDGKRVVNSRSLRPFGGGPTLCKGRAYAETACLTAVAGVLALWNIEPSDSPCWVLPRPVKATAVSMPASDIRVKLRRRKLS